MTSALPDGLDSRALTVLQGQRGSGQLQDLQLGLQLPRLLQDERTDQVRGVVMQVLGGWMLSQSTDYAV